MAFQRITVVDDSPEILDVLGDALRSDEVQVTMLSATTSVEEIGASSPDALIVDLRLGTDHLPGWEVIRTVRSDERLRDVPIIVCSGALDQMRGYGGAAIGPDTYLLPKPFSLDDLESVLAEALGGPGAEASERAGSSEEPAAVGPGAGATPVEMALDAPDFGADPGRWFDWVGAEMGNPAWRELLVRMAPASWTSPDGHPWRLIITPRGVEVRPDLVSPFLRYGNQPMVSALGLTDAVEVELTTHSERWVGRFTCGTFDVGALGRAMLEERKLPHDNLPQLFPLKRGRPSSGIPPDRVSAFRVGDSPQSLRR